MSSCLHRLVRPQRREWVVGPESGLRLPDCQMGPTQAVLSLAPRLYCPELAVHKPASRASAISLDLNKQSGRIRRRFVMRIRQGCKVVGETCPAFGTLNRFEALRKGLRLS